MSTYPFPPFQANAQHLGVAKDEKGRVTDVILSKEFINFLLRNQHKLMETGRILWYKGADVVAADEITLNTGGNFFDITGTTTINHINNTNWKAGSIIYLQFDASVTVTHNAGSPTGTEASIFLDPPEDFSAVAGNILTLIYDGTLFQQLSRTPMPVEAAYETQIITTAPIDLTTIAETDILDVTEAGKILSIAARVKTAPTGTVGTATLDLTTDGGTKRVIPLYTGALVWAAGITEFAEDFGSDGEAIGDRFKLPLGVIYKTSMKVSVDVTTAMGTNGVIQLSVLRAKKL